MRKRRLYRGPDARCPSVRPSVCPSVRLSLCLSVTFVLSIQTAEDIVKLLCGPSSAIILVFFDLPAPIPNSTWNPFRGGAKYKGWENFAIFD